MYSVYSEFNYTHKSAQSTSARGRRAAERPKTISECELVILGRTDSLAHHRRVNEIFYASLPADHIGDAMAFGNDWWVIQRHTHTKTVVC